MGHERRHAGRLLSDALNSAIPQITTSLSRTARKSASERCRHRGCEREAGKNQDRLRALGLDRSRARRPPEPARQRPVQQLVPRHFDGSDLQLPGASSVINPTTDQRRVIGASSRTGQTYIAHAVARQDLQHGRRYHGEKRLGLISKAMTVGPGHCLAQASREFLTPLPNARILVADETNLTKDKRHRFLSRAATPPGTGSSSPTRAFKFIPAPAEFEVASSRQINGDSELLGKVDGDDRISRKRIESMKEKLEANRGPASRKDDLLTIGEIGIDQIIVDEAQEFRKLSFPSNMTSSRASIRTV